MELQLAFDPRLNIEAKEFAAHWRAGVENSTIGEIALRYSMDAFVDPNVIAILQSVLIGVPSNAIWDAIKFTCQRVWITRNEPPKSIEVQHIRHPDGTEVLIVRMNG
jgi:hypothetical protein